MSAPAPTIGALKSILQQLQTSKIGESPFRPTNLMTPVKSPAPALLPPSTRSFRRYVHPGPHRKVLADSAPRFQFAHGANDFTYTKRIQSSVSGECRRRCSHRVHSKFPCCTLSGYPRPCCRYSAGVVDGDQGEYRFVFLAEQLAKLRAEVEDLRSENDALRKQAALAPSDGCRPCTAPPCPGNCSDDDDFPTDGSADDESTSLRVQVAMLEAENEGLRDTVQRLEPRRRQDASTSWSPLRRTVDSGCSPLPVQSPVRVTVLRCDSCVTSEHFFRSSLWQRGLLVSCTFLANCVLWLARLTPPFMSLLCCHAARTPGRCLCLGQHHPCRRRYWNTLLTSIHRSSSWFLSAQTDIGVHLLTERAGRHQCRPCTQCYKT